MYLDIIVLTLPRSQIKNTMPEKVKPTYTFFRHFFDIINLMGIGYETS